MHRILRTILSLILIIQIFSCQKELHFPEVEPIPADAIYTLDGAPDACSSVVINGNYYVNTPLDSSNTVSITATVTKTGIYSIATETINGVSFSASGTFTNTGSQNVTLHGTGTPTIICTRTYVPGTDGCSFTVNFTSSPVVHVTPYYFDITVDGIHYTGHVDDMTYAEGGGIGSPISGVYDTVTLHSFVWCPLSSVPAGVTSFGIEKAYILGYQSLTDAAFKSFLIPASYPFAQGNGTEPGIYIRWTGPQGSLTDVWSSSLIAQPASSNFTITSIEDDPTTVEYGVRFTASFNCTLYNSTTGEQKLLTNGTYVGRFIKIHI